MNLVRELKNEFRVKNLYPLIDLSSGIKFFNEADTDPLVFLNWNFLAVSFSVPT